MVNLDRMLDCSKGLRGKIRFANYIGGATP
jgi:hypothetical protein